MIGSSSVKIVGEADLERELSPLRWSGDGAYDGDGGTGGRRWPVASENDEAGAESGLSRIGDRLLGRDDGCTSSYAGGGAKFALAEVGPPFPRLVSLSSTACKSVPYRSCAGRQ